MRVLYRNGTVYSDSDAFATAMLTDAGTVAWLGDESGADARSKFADEVVDLSSRLVTPGFVDAGDPAGEVAQWLARGVVAVVARGQGARVAADAETLADLPGGTVAVVDPRSLPAETDLSVAAAAGVPLALGTAAGAEPDPWRLLQHALARGLSARAAFLAHTRGAWRAAANPSGTGRLQIGAEATFVVWEPCELGVQVVDVGRSAFSSDARSGLPPLPVLGRIDDDAWAPPRAERVVVAGRDVGTGDTPMADTPQT